MNTINKLKQLVACPKPPLWGGLVGLFIFLSSCSTIIDLEDMPDPTPSKGKVTLTTDWTNRTTGIEIPASYTVSINNQTLNYNKPTNELPQLSAGTYPTLIHNSAEKITIEETKVTVTATAGIVDPSPGWLFSSMLNIVYEDDKQKEATATMQQQVRQLTIELTVKEGNANRIQGITAELSGVASQLNMSTNEHSAGAKVVPIFSRTNDKLTASVRLLGITGAEQKLTINLTFTDGRTQTIDKEVNDLLTGFNTEKHNPMLLTADLNTPVEAGFEATITAWEAKTGGSGIAW